MKFIGHINISPPLNAQEKEYFKKFSETRRMDRKKGPYYVNGGNNPNDINNDDVLDYNKAPQSQPGLWCKWVNTEDGSKLVWNGYKKFYAPKEWLEYIIIHFLGNEPVAKLVHPEYFNFLEGHILNGIVTIQENDNNYWFIVVKNNKVFINDSLLENIDQPQMTEFRDKQLLFSDILELIKLKEQFSTLYDEHFIIIDTKKEMKKYPIL